MNVDVAVSFTNFCTVEAILTRYLLKIIYKTKFHHVTLAPCFKFRQVSELSTNYLHSTFYSPKNILFSNLTFHCSVLDILIHLMSISIFLAELIHFCLKPQFTPHLPLFHSLPTIIYLSSQTLLRPSWPAPLGLTFPTP